MTSCIDQLTFISDLNYPDNNGQNPPVMQPGQAFTKGWRVKNTGTCTWDSSYTFIFMAGNVPAAAMGGQPTSVQGTVPPGAQYDVNVNLVAPTAPGTYQAFWQLTNSIGALFGQKLRVTITVAAAPTATPAPTQTPSPSIQFTASTTSIKAGEPVTFKWDVQNVKAVYFYSDQDGTWQGHGVPGVGEETVYPPYSQNYYLRVEKPDNTVETRNIYITVTPVATAPVIQNFSIVPEGQMSVGQCVNISWSVTGDIQQVNLTKNTIPLWDGAPVAGNLQDCPTNPGQIAYGITAIGPGGTSNAVKYVNLIAPQPTAVPPTATKPPVPPTRRPSRRRPRRRRSRRRQRRRRPQRRRFHPSLVHRGRYSAWPTRRWR